MDISSLQNSRVKFWVKLREDKKRRKEECQILVEGYDELALAAACGFQPQTLLSAPELIRRPLQIPAAENLTVNRAVFEKISYRENPDGWLGIFSMPQTTLAEISLPPEPLILVAESIEKPGNLGAILRTAEAAGVSAVLVCDPRADIWNSNVIRASRGAVFALPVIEADSLEALNWLKSKKTRILAATPSAKTVYTQANLRGALAIAIGTEDKGLTDFWIKNADLQTQIPMFGKVNSLNVSIATALIVYEALRQRK